MNISKDFLRTFVIIIMASVGAIASIFFVIFLFHAILQGCYKSTPAEIIHYHPTVFKEETPEPFFYSIGNDLKRSNTIDPHAKTLFSCNKIREAFVSPDNRMILLICGERGKDGTLWLVSDDGIVIRKITTVKDMDKKEKIPGEYFIRDDRIQSSPDSRSFYVIRDQYSSGTRHTLTPMTGSLLRYDISYGYFEVAIPVFTSHHYFFGQDDRIYYRVWDSRHSKEELRCRQKGRECNRSYITNEREIFYSFSSLEYKDYILPLQGTYLDDHPSITRIYYESEKVLHLLLTVKWGHNFKGGFNGIETLRSVFLPGERYLPLKITSKQFSGFLLIDTATGWYKEIPSETFIYRNFNTLNRNIKYEIHDSGIRLVASDKKFYR